MSKEKTLHEICDEFAVTRRAVQGYEKEGLVFSTGKNKYGYLLYDVHEQERIRKIKQYQNFGYSIKEIVKLIDAPIPVRREMLKKQIHKLQEENKRITDLITEMKTIISSLEDENGGNVNGKME